MSTLQPSESTPSTPSATRSYTWPRRIFWSLVAAVVLTVVGLIVYVSFDLPSLDLIENPDSDLSTQLISADGVVLHQYYSLENRVNVKLSDISPYVMDALVATEDIRFYQHGGIDPESFAAIAVGLVRSGRIRGGSTITMQLVRNLYDEVGDEPTVIRKFKEYLVSAYLERKFTKREIIEAYLNTVNIYGNSYGIETAANRLFDKKSSELTIEQAATVVAMLKGQGVYNPYVHPDRTQAGRNVVLGLMVKNGFLDSTRINVDSLRAIPLASYLARQEDTHVKGLAPYFREHVRLELQTWCKENGYDLYRDGLRVYTTLDSRMQYHAENALRKHLRSLQLDFDKVEDNGKRILRESPEILTDLMKVSERYRLAKKAKQSDEEIAQAFRTAVPMTIFDWKGPIDTVLSPMDSLAWYARILESGLVAIDPTNGHVKAWVGGNDYKFFKYDHVAKGKRQVGSTFKPFVYGAAIDAGYMPCDKFLNQPVLFDTPGGGRWTPKNADGSIGGMMTLQNALANSVNLITAQLIRELTPNGVANFAYKMGIKTKLEEVPALCLGTTDLNVLELTNAYGTFANKGVRNEPVIITRIEDRNGNVLANFPGRSQEVLSPEKAWRIIQMLEAVVDQGTAQRLRYRYQFKNEIAAKTGTTQNQSDGWFVGATPNLVTGIWVGCADRRMRFRSLLYGQGANMALPMWAYFMQDVYQNPDIGLTLEPFYRPEGLDPTCRALQTDPSGSDLPDDTPDPDDLGL